MSFADPKYTDDTVTGGYGVCSGEGIRVESPQLKLNADNTFYYLDSSDPGKKIEVTGTWVNNNGTVILKDYTSPYTFHTKWKMDKNGKCIKSHKGMTFYRLCDTGKCK
jgi:hypothetical protein